MVSWDEQPLDHLQELFYQQSLPAVQDPINFQLAVTPYMCRSGAADCYFFHVNGKSLADLYEKHGEGLLQRNIRVDQRLRGHPKPAIEGHFKTGHRNR